MLLQGSGTSQPDSAATQIWQINFKKSKQTLRAIPLIDLFDHLSDPQASSHSPDLYFPTSFHKIHPHLQQILLTFLCGLQYISLGPTELLTLNPQNR